MKNGEYSGVVGNLESALAVVLSAFLLFPAWSCAGIYKWVDENGRVHYGDKPLSGGAAKVTIKTESTGGYTSDQSVMKREERRRKLLNIYQEEREKKKADLRVQAEQEKQRKKKCNKAKITLEKMRNASYLYEDDPSNPEILTESEREQAELEWEGAVKKWCD